MPKITSGSLLCTGPWPPAVRYVNVSFILCHTFVLQIQAVHTYMCDDFLQEAVQVLLKHSADVNARDKNWQTPLHIAAANKAVRCAEALVPLLSNVNVSDRAGRTALHHAAFSGHLEVELSPKVLFDSSVASTLRRALMHFSIDLVAP